MQFVMHPGMVYEYPLAGVGLLLVGLAALGAVLCELTVHQFLSIELRRRHNDVAAAIFSVIGVTFAVLLAFVAMLANAALSDTHPMGRKLKGLPPTQSSEPGQRQSEDTKDRTGVTLSMHDVLPEIRLSQFPSPVRRCTIAQMAPTCTPCLVRYCLSPA